MANKMVHFTKATTTLKGFSVTKEGTISKIADLLVFDTVKSLETAKKLLAEENGLDKAVVVATDIVREEKHYEIPMEIFLDYAIESEPQRVRKPKAE